VRGAEHQAADAAEACEAREREEWHWRRGDGADAAAAAARRGACVRARTIDADLHAAVGHFRLRRPRALWRRRRNGRG